MTSCVRPKVERQFGMLEQLFIRYGRRMLAYEVVRDAFGVLLVGQPFGPQTVRVIGDAQGKPLLATYNVRHHSWKAGETPLTPLLKASI